MIKKLADGTQVALGQKKSDKTVKVGYLYNDGKWVMKYTGTFAGLKEWLKGLIKEAEDKSVKQMIADMCGTSYEAAMEDMGLSEDEWFL
jgi:hypothetical protein